MSAACENDPAVSGKKKGSLLGRSCMRCGGAPKIVVRLLDPLCRACFEEYFVHKFRAVLGKSRAIQYGEKVLIAVSGGPSSSAMLHLVCAGLSARARRKLQIQPSIVVVDERSIGDDGAWDEEVEVIKRMVEDTGFPCYFISLEDVFGKDKLSDTAHAQQLRTLFSSLTSLTAREDMLQSIRSQILVSVARQHGCNKVMVGDNSTRLAVRLLSNVSQGRGGTVSLDTGMCDERYGDITLIRPMREFAAKEIAYYNHCNDVVTTPTPSLSFASPINGSIDRLTEQFIAGLQSEFPSTVSTIFNTGNKLTVNEQDDTESRQCVLCGSPLPTVSPHSQASAVSDLEQALKPISSEINPQTAVLSDGVMEVNEASVSTCVSTSCGSCDCSASQLSPHSLPIAVLLHHVCYGCERTVRDSRTDLICLPPKVVLECQRQEQRTKMKNVIQDFLLDDS